MIDERAFDEAYVSCDYNIKTVRKLIEAYQSARTAPTEGEVERVARAIEESAHHLETYITEYEADAYAGAAIAAMNPTPERGESVRLPTSGEEAKLMWLLGERYVREHHPEYLTAANVPFKE